MYYRGRGYINSAFNKKVAPPGPIGATTITYVLDNLLYFTRYEIKVAAFNDAGVGVESSIIFTETKPGGIVYVIIIVSYLISMVLLSKVVQDIAEVPQPFNSNMG